MYKKFLCWMLAFAFVLVSGGDKLILSVGAGLIADGELDNPETIAMMPDFADDAVMVVLTHEASLQFIEYTPEDFPEIECADIRDLSTGKGAKVQAVLRGEQLEMESIGARFMNRNIDIEGFQRILCLKLANPGKGNVLRATAALEQREDVHSASPNYIIRLTEGVETNATTTNYVWGSEKIQLYDAWEIETGDSGVLVGILDAGIDVTHPDLSGRVNTALSYNFTDSFASPTTDPDGHGTKIAGIIAAQNSNSNYVRGVCKDVTLVSLKVIDSFGVATAEILADAIDYAEQLNIPILNISLNIFDTVLTDLRRAINNYSGLLVCAIGNDGANVSSNSSAVPASLEYHNILSVGASTANDTIWVDSNYGSTTLDIFAPGENIVSCMTSSICNPSCRSTYHIEDGYHIDSGTSFAAPFVTGVAGLILSLHPDATTSDIKLAIITSEDQADAFSNKCISGGRLNAYESLMNRLIHSNRRYTSINGAYHQVSCDDCGVTWTEAHLERPGVEVCIYCQEYLW